MDMKKKPRANVFWAGFVDGKIHVAYADDGFGGYGNETTLMPMLFETRTEARRRYMDVRKVEIREIAK